MKTKTPKSTFSSVKHQKYELTVKSGLCSITLTILGIIFIIIATFLTYNKLTRLITNERLLMKTNMPPYKWWKTVDVDISLKMYVFNILNAEEFISGADKKLKVREIGPIVFREVLQHNNISFHENSTMSYTSHRQLVFVPELNEPGILNQSITVPNLAVLGMAGLLNSNTFLKMGFNFMMMTSGDNVFIKTTIYNYFFNISSPIMETANTWVPFMVPTDNMGVLSHIYDQYNDRVNVRYGFENGDEQFFRINTYNYRPTVPGFKPENGDCFASVVNSSEGASYPQHLTKNSVLLYWRRTLCRVAPLYFEEEVSKHSILGYKFVLRNDSYDRYPNATSDCYKGQAFDLPDGLSDISKCSHDFPVAASSPHFYARHVSGADRIDGMTPDFEKHHSYIIADPVFGIPLEQCARVQSNLVVPKISGFSSDIQKFSEFTLPMFWLEYMQNELPSQVLLSLKIYHNFLETVEPYLPIVFFVIAAMFLIFAFKCILKKKTLTNFENKEIEKFITRIEKDNLDVTSENVILKNNNNI